MKKIISIILAAVMVFSFTAPAFAEDEKLPVILIKGQGSLLYDENGEEIYPLDVEWGEFLSKNMGKYLKEITEAQLTGDYSTYCDDIYNDIAPIYEKVKLDQNGELPNGQNPTYHDYRWNIPTTEVIGKRTVYHFGYDWRISPIELAEQLDEYIDKVISMTGKEQVNIISRCLGTNIALAYLSAHGEEGKVNSCVLYTSAIDGINLLNGIFSGDIVIDPDVVDRFVTFYTNDGFVVSDENTTELLVGLVSLFNQVNLLGYGTQFLSKVVNDVKDDVIPRIMRSSYATFPSYWAMVGADYYEQAKEFIFGDMQDEWAGLIEKTDAYYEIEKNADELLLDLKENHNVNIAVIAKYGTACLPLTADAGEESDNIVTTKRLSMGASCTLLNEKFSDSYIKAAGDNAKYISADRKIDASTCLFPDTTWFIKYAQHRVFPDCVNDLIFKFVESNGKFDINTDPSFTQYLEFVSTNNSGSDDAKGILKPIVTAEDTNDDTLNYVSNPLQALFKFLAAFIKFIVKYIKSTPQNP